MSSCSPMTCGLLTCCMTSSVGEPREDEKRRGWQVGGSKWHADKCQAKIDDPGLRHLDQPSPPTNRRYVGTAVDTAVVLIDT